MPRKIMVVDDSEINRALLQKTLGDDYDIVEARNGKEAMSLLHKGYRMFSAILLDLLMPEMDGYEVLRAVRENILFTQIPVIIVTSSEDEQSRVRALSLGANDFIVKPFNPDIIRHCLKNNITLRETASILNAIQKDKLTGLYNREAFFEKVGALIAEHEPGHYLLSCFDIDSFKLINDRYGAAEGDRILQEIGRAVSADMDILRGVGGRISADNFAVLLPVVHKDMSITRLIVKNKMAFSDKQAIVFSVGRYIITDLSLPASALYDRAYIAKQSVKGQYAEHIAYFDDEMLGRLVRDQQIIADMDAAITEHQFEVWFHPQRNHTTGALVGAEALVRWRHQEKGLIPPGDFIPIFEQNGFVYELDKYVWEESCRLLRKWTDEGRDPVPVSVNISRYDIFRPDFIEVLSGLLAKYNIPAELLRLEITETAFAKSIKVIVRIVKQLIALGFTVEIDDFGSGYSSLNTLNSVPAQVIKLDMRFLEDDDNSGRMGNIIESIVRMAKWMGMSVIAEGVEDIKQADYLASIGCNYIQGYLYARPMCAAEYEDYFTGLCREGRLSTMEAVANLNNNSFWEPKSMDTLIFNSYVGAACIFEYYNGHIELLRANRKFSAQFGGDMTIEDTLKLDWISCLEPDSLENVRGMLRHSGETGEEFTGEYVFKSLKSDGEKTYLRATMRVIAKTAERRLVYCTSENVTAQRRAEQLIRVSERKKSTVAAQLKAVMDNVGCGVTAVTFKDGKVEYLLINDRYLELLGYTRRQYDDMEAFEPIYVNDRERVKKASFKSYESGQAQTAEFRAVRADGTIMQMRCDMTMTRFEGIKSPVQLSIFTDITKERQSAGELLDNLPGGTALYEYNGSSFRIIHINKRYWELVGREAEDYSELSIESAFHPDDIAEVHRELEAAIRENRDIACDVRLRYGEHGYRPFHGAGHIVAKPGGIYTINAIYTPVSDEAMAAQEMLPVALQSVMDFSSEVSFVKNRSLKYISVSRKFAILAGLEDEKALIGKTSADVFPPMLASDYDKDDTRILECGQPLVDFETSFMGAYGSVHLMFSKYPLFDGRGRVIGIYGTGRDVTETLKMQSRLELLNNSIPGGIAVYEGDPSELSKIKMTYFSDGLCRILGYSREEYEKLLENDPFSLMYDEDVARILEKIKSLTENGEPIDIIYRARAKNGSMKWINVKAVMGETDGVNTTANAVFFDVTEQKNATEKLRVSEEVNRIAIQQSNNIVCRFDIATRTLTVPENVNPIFDLLPEQTDIPYKTVRDGNVSADTSDAYVGFYESIIGGEKTGAALFMRASQIGWRWIEAHFTTIFSDGGTPLTSVITMVDVTESIEKDAAYKKWQQSFRDKPPQSYSLYHCNFSKNTVIDSTEGLLIPVQPQYDDGTLDKRTACYVRDCVFEDDRDSFLSVMNREIQLLRFRQNKLNDTLEYREKLPDGDIRWLKVTIDLVDLSYSDDIEAYVLFEDIDRTKRAELKIIEQAENDPLTGVLNRNTFAQRVNSVIHASKQGTIHALLMLDLDGFKLVNDVFGHAAGDRTLEEVAGLLVGCSRKNDFVGRLGGDEFVVFLTDVQSEEAAAKKAGQICELTRKTLSYEVQISGSVGIAVYPGDGDSFENLYRKADEILYRVKNSGKNNFAFYRDTASDEDDDKTEYRALASLSEKKPRMLIIDDSKTDCEMLCAMFERAYSVEKALDGGTALIKLRHYGSAISIVLLDLMMPGIDGFAILEKMQANAQLKSIPVIVVSGDENYETGLKAIRAGAADYVSKPVDAELLNIRVKSALTKAENERLRAYNSFLELQSDEMNSYKTALDKTGTFVIIHDWTKSSFTYSPAVTKHLDGKYDKRSLWRILLSDLIADSGTVKRMQQLVHDVANDRTKREGTVNVMLKSVSGGKLLYEMNVYKQTNDYGLTDKLVLTFREAENVGAKTEDNDD